MKKISLIIVILCLLSKISISQIADHDMMIVPKTPEAASFDQYLNTPAPAATGTINVDVPLYTIKLKDFNLPISLSYVTSGIKAKQLSNPAGIGWMLNAGGMVSRDIMGIADESSGGWYNTSYAEANACKDGVLEQFYSNYKDPMPDIYSYNFNNNAGRFFYKKDKTLLFTLQNSINIVKKPSFEFEITDNFGNRGVFDQFEKSVSRTVKRGYSWGPSSSGTVEGSGITVAKPSLIETPNNEEIRFEYIPYQYSTGIYTTGHTRVRSLNQPFDVSDFYPIRSLQSYEILLVSKITTANEILEFEYSDSNSVIAMQKKLTRLVVKSAQTNKIIKEYAFNYRVDGSRLFLTEVLEVGINKKWEFDYVSHLLPDLDSHALDVFGYYNGASQSHMIPVTTGGFSYFDLTPANREVNDNVVDAGSLSKVTYPTGGDMEIIYEANKEDKNGSSYYAPGVRVQKCIFHDSPQEVAKTITYTYSNLGGKTHKVNVFPFHKSESGTISGDTPPMENNPNYYCSPAKGKPITWSSSPISAGMGQTQFESGFFYGTVKINTLNGAGQVEFTTEYEYSGFEDNYILKPFLTSKIERTSQNKVREERYSYSEITNSTIEAHVTNTCFVPVDLYIDCEGTRYDNAISRRFGEPEMTHYLPLLRAEMTSKSILKDDDYIIEYYNNELETVQTQISYDYNERFIPTTITKYSKEDNINKVVSVNKKQYTGDPIGVLTDFSSSVSSLKSNHILDKVLHHSVLRPVDGELKVVDGIINEFNASGNISKVYRYESNVPYLPSTLNSANLLQKYKLVADYTYLSKNVVDVWKRSGESAFVWSYNNEYPVIKADQVSNTILQMAAQLVLSSHFQGKSLDQFMDQLGNLTTSAAKNDWKLFNGSLRSVSSLSNTHVNTFTYDPLIGITSQTDPNGVTTYYEYDNYGRLKNVKDDDSNLIETNESHYFSESSIEPFLSFNLNSISYTSTSTSKSVQVSSHTSWEVVSKPSWITISNGTGASGASFTATCYSNGGGARNGVISVKAGSITKNISVAQEAGIILNANKYSVILQSSGGPLTRVDVTCNQSWTIEKDQSWIKLSNSSGTGNGYFYVSAYTSSVTRTGIVTIQSGNKTFEIDVLQNGSSGGGGPIEEEFPEEL